MTSHFFEGKGKVKVHINHHNINQGEQTTMMAASSNNMTIDINDRITKLRKMSLNSSPFQEEQRRSFGSVVSTSSGSSSSSSSSSSCMMSSSHSSSSIMSSTSSSSSNNKSRRQRRSVHFAETSSVVVLPCRSTSDYARCWYSRSDLAAFKQNVKSSSQSLRQTRTAKLMKHVAYLAAQTTYATGNSSSSASSSQQDQPSSCSSQTPLLEMASNSKAAIRGMEHLLCPMVCKLLLKRRRLVNDAVLREQLKLNTENSFIDEEERVRRIALVAHRQSKFSKEWTRRITSLQQEL